MATMYHCPACELIFKWKTVLEHHLREDHPSRHFDYPQEQPADADWPMAHKPHRHVGTGG